MNIDDDCHCPDPRREGRRLYLCGSDLCRKLTSQFFKNGSEYMDRMRVILSEDEEK